MLTQTAVLDRIFKLLAIQEARGASEAEAQIAAEHVQRLLQEYNLTLSEVERHSGGSDQPSARKKDGIAIKNNNMPYFDKLATGVAETNFCLGRITTVTNEKGRRRKQVIIIGREVNVHATKLTFEYLVEACFREMRKNYQLTLGGGDYSKDALWFLEGMCERLYERLKALQAEREAESAKKAEQAHQGNGTHQELVLSDVYGSEQDLNNDFLNGFPAGTTAARKRAEAERQAKIDAELKRLQEGGMEWAEAWYRAHGYGDKSVEYAHAYNKRSRRSGSGRGYSHGWSSRDDARYRKVNSTAYQSGVKAGSTVSLSEQVGAGSSPRQITKK